MRKLLAMTLVGWYLLMAPANPIPGADGTYSPKLGAPLASWDLIHSYDSAMECEEERHDNTKRANLTCVQGQWCGAWVFAAHEKCVASDDPRLIR